MQVNQTENIQPEDDDLSFDMHETSTTATAVKPEDTGSDMEKQELLGKKEFKPLSEEEKQPKIPDLERIKEMNRRTAIDD